MVNKNHLLVAPHAEGDPRGPLLLIGLSELVKMRELTLTPVSVVPTGVGGSLYRRPFGKASGARSGSSSTVPMIRPLKQCA